MNFRGLRGVMVLSIGPYSCWFVEDVERVGRLWVIVLDVAYVPLRAERGLRLV